MSQEDELFGNDSDSSEEVMTKNDNNISYNKESDVDENDKYADEDYFGPDSEDYKKAPAFPSVKCPGEKIIDSYE